MGSFKLQKNAVFICMTIFMLMSVFSCNDHLHPLNIAGNTWLGYQPFYVAYELGKEDHAELGHTHNMSFIKQSHRFKITMLNSNTSVLRILSNSQLEGALLTLDEAIKFQSETGMALCVPLIVDYSYGADALIVNPVRFDNITGNKPKIGYESSAMGAYMLKRALDFKGLTSEDVIAVPLRPNEHVKAFISGHVDGVITFEPYQSQLLSNGGEVYFSSKDIPKEIVDVLVVKQDIWNERHIEIEVLVNSFWREGLVEMSNKNGEGFEIIKVNTGLSELDITRAIKGIYFPDVNENRKILKDELNSLVDKISGHLINIGMMTRPSTLTSCK